MEVLILLIFVSLVLAAGGVSFFAFSVRERTHEHAARLALLPLEEDDGRTAPSVARDGTKPDLHPAAPIVAAAEVPPERTSGETNR